MSLAVRIIPCLDVRGGRVVKGINFKDIVDAGDPAEAAKRYDAEGAMRYACWISMHLLKSVPQQLRL